MAKRVRKGRGSGAGASDSVEATAPVQNGADLTAARLAQEGAVDGIRDPDLQAFIGRLAHALKGHTGVDSVDLALAAECLETVVGILRGGTDQERQAARSRLVARLTFAFRRFLRRYPAAVRDSRVGASAGLPPGLRG